MTAHHHHPYVGTTCGQDALPDLLDRVRRTLIGPLHTHRFGHDDHDHIDIDETTGDVLAAYREQAEALHERLSHERGILVAELLGATGAGKTRLLEQLLARTPEREAIGVIVGDVAGEDDAARLRQHGVSVETVNTGKECHLDPKMVEEALEAFDLDTLDRLYIENVGNMVCPADFPLGATVRLLVVSTTEGEDVVRKHPLLFQSCDAAVINKVDVAPAVEVDVERMVADVEEIDPEMAVFRTDARAGDGLDDLASFIENHREYGHRSGTDRQPAAGTGAGE